MIVKHNIQNHSAFTGKERDEETGYGYFGARYMDHELMTMWLSVDPMADKYPSISPYAYCVWNPVKIVDPDGREIVIHHGKYDYHLKMEKDKENGKYTFRWVSRQNGIDVELSNNNTEKINEEPDSDETADTDVIEGEAI